MLEVLLPSSTSCSLLSAFIMVLLDEAFHGSDESLNLFLEGGGAWFVSLNIVGGCHRASKHHATFCLGSNCMAYKSAFPTNGTN